MTSETRRKPTLRMSAPQGTAAADAGKFIASEVVCYARLIKARGITAN